MSTTSRDLPRFLPTLTEVVQPSSLARGAPDPVMPNPEELVKSVLQRVDSLIENRLRQEVSTMVSLLMSEQLQTLNARLRQELEAVVRQAVSEAMTSLADQNKLK